MQKHAYSSSKQYQTLFTPLPVSSDEPLYFDRNSVYLPYAEDFPQLHYHNRYEIGICESGEGLFLSDGIFSSVSKGDIIFVAPESAHYSRSLSEDAPCICRFAYVRREDVENLLVCSLHGDNDKAETFKNLARNIPAVLRASEYPEYVVLLTELMSLCQSDTSDIASIVTMRTVLFLLESQRRFSVAAKAPLVAINSDNAVAMVSEHISLNYSGSDTSKELSQKCHISESQLRRRFIAAYGMPPIAYRNYLRNNIAAELLVRTRLPISEISERIGYTATSDFYRAFKKTYGVSPSVYRSTKNI